MAVPEDIRHLVRLVPSPPDVPFPAGATEDQIDAFAARTGVSVSPDLRDWWRFTNGPIIGPGGMYGIRPAKTWLDIEPFYARRPEWRQRGWVPIAGDGCGNAYILAADGELGPSRPVFFFDREHGDPSRAEYVVASGLWAFIRFLLKAELGDRRWPFDRQFVLKADRELAECAKLPWDE